MAKAARKGPLVASTSSEGMKDCGEHALSAFGFADVNQNGHLEIFAACSQASLLGGFVEKARAPDTVRGGF
jgi:hypothetical protein